VSRTTWQTSNDPFELIALLRGKIGREQAVHFLRAIRSAWRAQQLDEATRPEEASAALARVLAGRNSGLDGIRDVHLAWQAEVMREALAPPDLPAFSAAWRTPEVLALARECRPDDLARREDCFRTMPILGDALEEAGCDVQEVLEHCRLDGPHRRECWVLGLILGTN
jgi:hypothetical protein